MLCKYFIFLANKNWTSFFSISNFLFISGVNKAIIKAIKEGQISKNLNIISLSISIYSSRPLRYSILSILYNFTLSPEYSTVPETLYKFL